VVVLFAVLGITVCRDGAYISRSLDFFQLRRK